MKIGSDPVIAKSSFFSKKTKPCLVVHYQFSSSLAWVRIYFRTPFGGLLEVEHQRDRNVSVVGTHMALLCLDLQKDQFWKLLTHCNNLNYFALDQRSSVSCYGKLLSWMEEVK